MTMASEAAEVSGEEAITTMTEVTTITEEATTISTETGLTTEAGTMVEAEDITTTTEATTREGDTTTSTTGTGNTEAGKLSREVDVSPQTYEQGDRCISPETSGELSSLDFVIISFCQEHVYIFVEMHVICVQPKMISLEN